MNITFSSDGKRPTFKDNIKCTIIAEKYFKMSKDKSQINPNLEDELWAMKEIPDCLNIIKDCSRIIGFTWTVPCNKVLMKKFIDKKITEAQLLKEIKKQGINQKNFKTLYFCDAIIEPKYRGLGLATKSRVKTIKKLLKNKKIKPILFTWPFNEGGYKLGLKVARITGLKIKVRK